MVEGLLVGSGLTFFLTLIISVSFQFVGFLFTYLLSMTHAGRNGAKAGFGITSLQIGMLLHSSLLESSESGNPKFGIIVC
jgi:Protein of unknown function (DUF2370)